MPSRRANPAPRAPGGAAARPAADGSDGPPAPGDAPRPADRGGDRHGPARGALATLAFAALGVVYGDIGTSPLYALRACFNAKEGGVPPSPANVFGVLSLVFWSLVLVVSVKYLVFIMRADNRGEGGILALMALASHPVRGVARRRGAIVALGIFGAALLYGDGMITPAISVLGAVEGVGEATPWLSPYVTWIAAGILVGVFLLQQRGTARVAALFGPITLIWFVSIAALGVAKIFAAPGVLAAASPLHAVRFLADNGLAGFHTLGFVFLVVTGAEALYADMGHFGKRPIRAAWFTVVLPALTLNYFGQGALLLSQPEAAVNPFYRMVPGPLLYPMIAVATGAAVVASQALISGAFSLTRQALQLGFVPRMTIIHTSGVQPGQIYVPSVNWTLMAASVGLVFAFGSADGLAAAYGIAVTATMTITTILFYFVAREKLGWSTPVALLVTAVFLAIDLAFLSANLAKFLQGGWFPLATAVLLYLLMTTWQDGRQTLQRIGQRVALPVDMVLEDLSRTKLPRAPGMAVFMNVDPRGAPLVLLHHLKHNKILHERVVLLSVVTEDVPSVADTERVESRELEMGFYQIVAHYGFMETPNVPHILALSEPLKGIFKPGETTYYLGRQTLILGSRPGMSRLRKRVFRIMQRNARPATAYFGLPANRVVELGAQVQL